ncbi:MAG: hypothetical protein ABIH83_04275 [Candidatus Micrarchaeota archaeon]
MAFSEDEAKIVLERLRVMPSTVKLNIGSYDSFTRDQLMKAVSERSEIGELVVKMQMEYLRSFKGRVGE